MAEKILLTALVIFISSIVTVKFTDEYDPPNWFKISVVIAFIASAIIAVISSLFWIWS